MFSLFLEILNDCSDVDEIKFQEDGTWCPMKPKKESVKVPTQSLSKVESKYVLVNEKQVLIYLHVPLCVSSSETSFNLLD